MKTEDQKAMLQLTHLRMKLNIFATDAGKQTFRNIKMPYESEEDTGLKARNDSRILS